MTSGRINVSVRRLGGGYGGKLSYPTPVAAGAALAAVKLNRPVRVVLDIETNMEMFGGRLPYLVEYKVGPRAGNVSVTPELYPIGSMLGRIEEFSTELCSKL